MRRGKKKAPEIVGNVRNTTANPSARGGWKLTGEDRRLTGVGTKDSTSKITIHATESEEKL